KLMQENMIKGSPVPHTIIRASLFFEWIRPIAQAGTDGDTVRVSHSLFHPVAADDVASAVAEVALDGPRNGTVEIAGPDLFYVDELVAKVLEHDKDPATWLRVHPGGPSTASRLVGKSSSPVAADGQGPTQFNCGSPHRPTCLSDP